MSREALQESLSAVMDNEADELELRRLLAASDDPQLRSTWSRYQLARAAMHKDLLLPHLDIAAAVSAALADEAVPASAVLTRGPWRAVGRMAVAASVTVAVLVGVRLYNQDELTGQQLAQQSAPAVLTPMPSQSAALLTGYSSENTRQPLQSPLHDSGRAAAVHWHEQSFPFQIRQHSSQFGAQANTQTIQSHAQAASLENP